MSSILDLEEALRSIGFRSDTYNEVVITTCIGDNCYSMPFGVKYVRGLLRGRFFKDSIMFRIHAGYKPLYSVLCITDDPMIFYNAVFRKGDLRYKYIREYGMPCISGCSACILVLKKYMRLVSDRLYVGFKPIRIRIYRRYPSVYHRFKYALIEALIQYTKIPFVDEESRRRLIEYIVYLRSTIYRSTRNKRYRGLIDDIIERIRSSGYSVSLEHNS